MRRSIRVLIVDDQRVVREGLALVLGLIPDVNVVGAATDGNQAFALALQLQPDVVLMDLRMPRCDGAEAIRMLRDRDPTIRVVVLTTYADDRSVLEALRAGARGYLTKDAGGAEIRQALQNVMEDQAVIDPAVQHHLLNAITNGISAPDSPAPTQLPGSLTARETEVLSLIAAGLSNAEIAQQITVSESTVKSHVNRVLAKTGCRDRAQAVVYAYQHGLAR